MSKTKSINFSKVVLKNLDGIPLKNIEFHKTLANVLYHSAETVDFVDIAIEINRGNTVELTTTQITEVKRVIDLPESRIATHARKTVHDFLDEVE